MMAMRITLQQITYQLLLIKFLILIISVLSVLCAQNRNISGLVYSSQTNLALQNVNIYIVGKSIGTSSDFDGSFTLENIPNTPFDLSFKIIGYQDTTFSVKSNENQISIGKIYLTTKILHFDEIYVGAHPDLGNSQSLSSLSLSGTEMQEKMKGTLAATLSDEMGVAVSSMGQATARPVLRGYSGDRFLLTDSGMELGDVSQSSTDHAVSMDMSTAQNIEIIRGAKTLLYGSNTIAGVVDIKKNSMPEVQFDHSHLHGTTGAESGNNSAFINAVYYYPFKDNQLRISGLSRNSGNQITPKGILKNTTSQNNELFAGFSNYQNKGRTSASLELLTMDYGIPGSPEGHIEGVDIEMKKLTQKIQHHRDIKFFPNIKTFDFEQRFIKYQHSEFETNQSFASVRIRQQLFSMQGKFTGSDRVIGSLFQYRQFGAGGFYWTPDTDELNLSIYAFREKQIGDMIIQGSARYEMLIVRPESSALNMSNLEESLINEKRFHLGSSMISIFKDWEDWRVSSNLMLTQRAPGIEDMFSDGPHLGSYSYEIGQPKLGLESTQGIESSLSYKKNKFSSTLTAFKNYSPNYHLSLKMGDGYIPGADWIEWGSGSSGWLYKYQMRGIKSAISGFELDISYRTDAVAIIADYSTVYGENITSNSPLPYMPPSKSRIRFIFSEKKNISYTLQFIKAFQQDRLGEFEEPTSGYALVDLFGSYNINLSDGSHKIIFQINNIFDEVHYNHLSKIKSIMPEMGRNISIQYRFLF